MAREVSSSLQIPQLHQARIKNLVLRHLPMRFFRLPAKERDAFSQDDGDNGKDHFVDEPGIEQDGIEPAAPNEPDVTPGLLPEFSNKIRGILPDELYRVVIGLALLPGENIVTVFMYGKGTPKPKTSS